MKLYLLVGPIGVAAILIGSASLIHKRDVDQKMQLRKKLADQSIQKSIAEAKKMGIIVPLSQVVPPIAPNATAYRFYHKDTERMQLILDYVSNPYVKPDPRQGMTGAGTVAELTPPQIAKLQEMLAGPVKQMIVATRLPSAEVAHLSPKRYPLISHFPELAQTRLVAKILNLDAVVAIRANRPAEFRADVNAIVRLTGQVECKNSLISFLVGYAIQAIGMSADAQALYKYPGNAVWATLVLRNLQAWKEPALLATAPHNWRGLSTAFDLTKDPTAKELEGDFGKMDKKLDAVAGSLTDPANLAKLQSICYRYELLQDQANQFQYFQPKVWLGKFSKADSYLSKQGLMGELAGNIVFDQQLSTSVCFRLRLITSLLTSFAQASLAKGTTGTWPASLVFPKPIQVPQSRPIPNVASALPQSTLSPIDPFTGNPIEYKKTVTGWALVGQIPKSIVFMPVAPSSETKAFAQPGMNAIVIELNNSKVKFLNIVRARG